MNTDRNYFNAVTQRARSFAEINQNLCVSLRPLRLCVESVFIGVHPWFN